MNRVSSCHPTVLAVYFLSVLLITMFSTNPILLFIALLGGMAFYAMLENSTAFWKSIGFYLPLFLVIAFTNPLFSHNGITPLFFLNGNPITLEAVLYGIDIAAMLIAVLYWFRCFHMIMTSDKWLFLLGKALPKISLLLTSALRFIPLFKEQAKKIRQAQKAMGLFVSDSWMDKLCGTVRTYSVLITWALENAVDTGASMKSRGYGLKGRSHFALFRFCWRDGLLISLIVALDIILFAFMAAGKLDFAFYPKVSVLEFRVHTLPAFLAFGLLSFLPFILEVKENLQWKYYVSKI